jgi:SPP1 gp7 family putative phage head morphogenesis protein
MRIPTLQDVEDAVLERGLELSEDELVAAVAAVHVYRKTAAAVAGVVFAYYPADPLDPMRPDVDYDVVPKILLRTVELVAGADRVYIKRLARMLVGVLVDEHRFWYRLYRTKIVVPSGGIKTERAVAEAGAGDAGAGLSMRQWAQASGIYRPIPKDVAVDLVTRPAPWDNLVWADRFGRLGAETTRAAEKAIVDSLAAGDDMARATRRLQKVLGEHRARAELIARTEIQRVSGEAARAFAGANSEHLLGLQTLATLDDRVCEECAPYDRQMFYYPPHPADVEDIAGLPAYPLHPRCRCRYVPISALWAKLGVDRPPTSSRPSMLGPTTAYDLDTWLRRMAGQGRADIARRVLGSKYTQWELGQPLHRFAGLGPVAPDQVLRRTRHASLPPEEPEAD